MSSCATIQKNGYYQTRHYSWHKKKKKEQVNRRVETPKTSENVAFEMLPSLASKSIEISADPILRKACKVEINRDLPVQPKALSQEIDEMIAKEELKSADVVYEERNAFPDRRRRSRIHWLVYTSVIASVLAPILFFVPVAAISTMGVVFGVAGILSAGLCLFLMKKREIRKNSKELVYASLIIGAAFFSSILIMLSLMSIFISVAT
ncbi:MFS transporter [bacterium]|nr:MFS transporter [bacterium]